MKCKECDKELTTEEEELGICYDCLYQQNIQDDEPDEPNKKLCSRCERKLPLSEFYKDNTKKDGYKNICKQCYSKYYQKNKHIWKSEIEHKKRKKEKWRPIIGKYYRIRDYRGQPREDTIIIKVVSVKKGKGVFYVINFEPIKKKGFVETQRILSYYDLWKPWLIEEVSEDAALRERNV